MLAGPASYTSPASGGLWGQLTRNQRITLAGLAGVAAIVVALFVNAARTPEYAVAFSNLRDEDAAAIVAKLKDTKIPYEIADRGTIKVASSQVHEVRLLMAAQGLPQRGSSVGFELFNQPHFGQTEFAEKVNYQRALEGELSRTIGRLDSVESARVHLVVPQPSLFLSAQKDATASVVVQLKPGRRLDSGQIQGVTHLVSSSVEGLKPQNISLMDTAGNVLSDRQAQNDPTRQTGNRAEAQRALESGLEDDIRTMLVQVLGPDKAIVRVTADLDWDQYEANIETFSPQQKQPQIRSQRQITEAQAQPGGQAGGVPGTESNVPTYPAGPGEGRGSAQAERRDVTTNYELSKTIEKTARAPGAIKRLSVAVALDSEAIADPNQADAISRLVATASGLDVNRGDVVTLTSLPFTVAPDRRVEGADSGKQGDMIITVARMVAMVLGPLLVVVLVWFVMRRGHPQPAALGAGTRASALLPPRDSMDPGLPVPELPDAAHLDSEHERVRKELTAMANANPSTVAHLIRTWLQEDHRR